MPDRQHGFEYRNIDYGDNEESCLLDSIEHLGVEFRGYQSTRYVRLYEQGKQTLIVCMTCERSMYEWKKGPNAWEYNPMLGPHAQSCDGRTHL